MPERAVSRGLASVKWGVSMKVVILAGGRGTRLMEETEARPKPMVEVGGRPILWHIMKWYAHYGFADFIICAGYKSSMIKEYFANFFLHASDVTFDLGDNAVRIHHSFSEPWRVTVVDTGLDTMTGGRIKRVLPYVGDEDFFLTYGDGLSNIPIQSLLKFHLSHGKLATMSTVPIPGRFGVLDLAGDVVVDFLEKPPSEAWINAGFFVLSPKIGAYLTDDQTVFEQHPLRNLARDGELRAFRHHGFWHAMDTLRDRFELQEAWDSGDVPWAPHGST